MQELKFKEKITEKEFRETKKKIIEVMEWRYPIKELEPMNKDWMFKYLIDFLKYLADHAKEKNCICTNCVHLRKIIE